MNCECLSLDSCLHFTTSNMNLVHASFVYIWHGNNTHIMPRNHLESSERPDNETCITQCSPLKLCVYHTRNNHCTLSNAAIYQYHRNMKQHLQKRDNFCVHAYDMHMHTHDTPMACIFTPMARIFTPMARIFTPMKTNSSIAIDTHWHAYDMPMRVIGM